MRKIRSASLKIGKVLIDELNSTIQTYPIIAPQNTVGSFCIYRRINIRLDNTKDLYFHRELVNMEIVVVCPTYSESIEKSIEIKFILEHLRGKYITGQDEVINITDCTLTDAREEYNSDAYLQIMTFDIEISNEYDEN